MSRKITFILFLISIFFNLIIIKSAFACNAGTAAPTLSQLSATVCGSNTFNLGSITASNLPSGTSLKWYTTSALTTEVSPLTVGAGTYYVAFHDAINNCKSPFISFIVHPDSDCDGIGDILDLDKDNDGILDEVEGYCRFLDLLGAPPITASTYPTTTFIENTTSNVTTVNPTGGTGTDDLSFTLDKTGSVQIKYNNAYNYYNNGSNPPEPLTDITNPTYNTFGIHAQGDLYTAPSSGGNNSSNPERYSFKPHYISQVAGNGSRTSPWQVKVQFYADIDGNETYDIGSDIMVTQINTYYAWDKVFRRDFKLNIPANSGTVKLYDLRDASFTGTTDAGYGVYATQGVEYVYSSYPNNTVNGPISFIGITNTEESEASGLILGFVKISPWKKWMADRWNTPYGISGDGPSVYLTSADPWNEMSNYITSFNQDIGFDVQYSDVINSTTAQEVYLSGYEVVADKNYLCSSHRDSDNDGTPDYLDLDSDNDGCTDAIEAGVTKLEGVSLQSDNTVSGPYGNNGLANIVETNDDNGIFKGIYTINNATNASLNMCQDSDNDGVDDSVDLDNDNDGVLDCVEKNLNDVSAAFEFNGTATRVSANEIQLTSANNDQAGQIWSHGKIDFSKNFNLIFDAFFGTNDGGADGIAAVFHNGPAETSAKGASGKGIGAQGIKYGLALELDTYSNSDPPANDPSEDHGQIWQTENQNNVGNGHTLPNLEDGNWHTVLINWDFATSTLSYTVDGNLAGTYTNTNISSDFNGTSQVYFGFTASTGGLNNEQKVRFNNLCSDIPMYVDTDGDGIENYLDLDSDGDGCSDAVEAGVTKLEGVSMENDNKVVSAPYGNNGFANSVETIDESGIYKGTYTYKFANDAAINMCNDYDGDGVADYFDLDDDNDGILDCIEKEVNNVTQAFVLNGNASSISASEVQLTPDAGSQAGRIWSKGKIDFSKSFTLTYEAYLGTKDVNGADGFAAVFHSDTAGTAASGAAGDGLGARGIMNGIALELDTYTNAGGNANDPTQPETGVNGTDHQGPDHGQIWKTVDQTDLGTSGRVKLENLEDGNWHKVIITWNANTGKLMYTVDGGFAGSYTNTNIINDIFGGSSRVHYGYTASTGGASNDQRIRFTNLCNDLPVEKDTDGDGISDYLDLDADNDGCPDAIEGASSSITQDSLVTSDLPGGNTGATSGTYNLAVTQNLGNNVDSNGIPTIANGGQDIGTSKIADSLVNAGTVSSDQISCTGTFNDLTVSGYTGNIQWQSSNDSTSFSNIVGQTTNTLPASAIGTITEKKFFRVVVTSEGGCTAISNSVTISVGSNPIISGNSYICAGSTDVLTADIAGGIWTSDETSIVSIDSTNGTINAKYYGTAVITYTLPTGCYDTMHITVRPKPNFSYNTTDLTCFQSGDGEINITGYGGSGSYIYYLLKESTTTPGTYEDFQNSGTAKSGPHTFTSLDAGNYSIKITDTNGCEQVGCNFVN